MILKFDHISFACQIEKMNLYIQKFEQYKVIFWEHELKNLEIKKAYMRNFSSLHDIALLNASDQYPIEITGYEECGTISQKYALIGEKIEIYSQDPDKTINFYKALGFKNDSEDTFALTPLFDRKKIRLQIKESLYLENTALDNTGFGSLAFIINDSQKMRRTLTADGIRVTDIGELCVNGKKLKIFFTDNGVGDIVEFIALK